MIADAVVAPARAAAFVTLATLALAGCGVEHANVSFDLNAQGTALIFSSADGDLYLLQLGSRSVERLTQTALEESTPVFSPDGQRVAYSAGAGDGAKSLFEYSFASKTHRRLTPQDDVQDREPRYSPDGSRLVFTRAHRLRPYSMGGQTWDEWDLYALEPEAEPRRLTLQNSRSPNDACFVDGGRTILFSASREGGRLDRQLYELRYGAETQDPRVVEADEVASGGTRGAWASQPAASRDGEIVSFISDRAEPFHYDVYVLTRKGGTPLPLLITTLARYNQNPRFAADGMSVWFLAGTQ